MDGLLRQVVPCEHYCGFQATNAAIEGCSNLPLRRSCGIQKVIAFHDLNPFPYKSIKNKRTHHAKLLEARRQSMMLARQILKANRKELDTIRLNYHFPDGEEENNTNRSRIDDEGSTCQKLDSEQQKEVIDLTDSPIAVLITCDENEDTAS
ncbi:unnamed protein product [Lepeophtheirus salmonis]|uniref:(salmon louse) hypothetical protein n=1 Tax=Lepeophtheirus salmonis TaxID=72036 RepID=A0A7R8H366_LEPSM|nr:unnamed protein product [Lepeophtheirus salmonis]CAF2837635.1 unnamed protein product [Lepeophtheirus salmonis]